MSVPVLTGHRTVNSKKRVAPGFVLVATLLSMTSEISYDPAWLDVLVAHRLALALEPVSLQLVGGLP